MKAAEEICSLLYNLVLCSAGLGALPLLRSRSAGDHGFWRGRLGFYGERGTDAVYGAREVDSGRPARKRIWFHAVSVGEVAGAVPILHSVHERLPDAALLLTVGTPQGGRFARAQLPSWVEVLPFPLEYPWVLRRAFQYLKPDLYVALESEFWPNVFLSLAHRGVPAVLVNGRLSIRSARRFRRMKPLFEPVFRQFRALAMVSEGDRENALSLGISADCTMVLGSSKYDGLAMRARDTDPSPWGEVLGVRPSTPVLIGGSLRGRECLEVMEAFEVVRRIEPRAIGVFAPRHMGRIEGMTRWLKDRVIPFHLLSDLEAGGRIRWAPVVLVDRIGILFDLYAHGDLIFCGGTLEPIGGHNILEPAAWKKPVFYGPHLQKVLYEHTILQSLEGSFLVHDARDLAVQWSHWVEHLLELKNHGRKAGEALEKLGGASRKQAELIESVLWKDDPHPFW